MAPVATILSKRFYALPGIANNSISSLTRLAAQHIRVILPMPFLIFWGQLPTPNPRAPAPTEYTILPMPVNAVGMISPKRLSRATKPSAVRSRLNVLNRSGQKSILCRPNVLPIRSLTKRNTVLQLVRRSLSGRMAWIVI